MRSACSCRRSTPRRSVHPAAPRSTVPPRAPARAGEWASARGRNVELSQPDSADRFAVQPGRAFWLVSRAAHRVSTSAIPGLSVSTGSSYPIVLAPGWNQLADPFDFPVEWASVQKPTEIGEPVAYDAARRDYAATPPERLQPFEGYFVLNPLDHAVSLLVPPVDASALSPPGGSPLDRAASSTGSGWRMGLRGRTEHAAEASDATGDDELASDGAGPPPPPPSEPPTGPSYRRDLRARGATGYAWQLDLRSSRVGEEIAL